MSSYSEMTVSQLRDEIRRVYTYEVNTPDTTVPATSKLRKAELIDLLVNAPREATNEDVASEAAYAEFAATLDKAVDSLRAIDRATRAAGRAFVPVNEAFTAAERRELNEAKYLGRYAGKRVMARLGKPGTGKFVGTVVDRVHRDSEPFNRGDGKGLLLLAVRHIGKPRVTLHRAEDLIDIL